MGAAPGNLVGMTRRWMPLGVSLVALSVVWSAALPGQAGPRVRRDSVAWASWSFPTGMKNRSIEYGAIVFTFTDDVSGETTEFGGLFKSRCVTRKGKDFVATTCRGLRGIGYREMSMDPLLRSASVRAGPNHVDWTATDDPQMGLYFAEEMCWSVGEGGEEEEGSGRGAGRIVDATATGRIFDKQVDERSGDPFAMMESGVMVTECGFFSTEELADFADGGGVSYSYRRLR